MTNAALRGKPNAGNPYGRFDEGEVASAAMPRRGSLFCKASALFTPPCLLLASLILFGCTTTNQYDIRPDADDDGIPTAVDWQNENDARIAAATKPEVLATFVESDAAADALLAQLKGAYSTDPVVMTQIGCVTQFVLCPKHMKAPTMRSIWVSALRRKIALSKDDYVATFCSQQLWQCE